ncbi:1429_t:CDS:1 [Dentiscutata erythropus]|uniref:1429_t:CDS:1 n=1 Tax=Dentiscutata erythropus TaxID=1348616 RepID=A0A9N8WRT5_9GLOM|nr:1429_t:CDS:1 [Dentiscutata erythropus]
MDNNLNQIFASEYFDTIFRFLPDNEDLHSCLLVNKNWATCAVPILWEAPFRFYDEDIPFTYDEDIQFHKVIQTYLAFIPDSTFRKLGYNRRIGLSNSRPLFFNYPSFIKELSYDHLLNAAIAYNCSEDIIIELFKLFAINNVRLRRLEIYSCLNNYNENLNKIGYLVPQFYECTSVFSRLTYFNCSYRCPMQKTQLFNAIANHYRNIKTLKVSIYDENEGMALGGLIRSQRNLRKFALINSNHFASFPIQALMNQKHSLDSLALEDMHGNRYLSKTKFFNYTICQLNSSAIDVLAQCKNVNKVKFKHCEGLNSSVFLPLAIAFSNLTSLEYTYGNYDFYDSATPIRLLSGLIMTSCNTLKRIVLDWYSEANLDITQLVGIIAQQVTNLEYLKIPLYTLEQLALIHQTHNQLKKLEINMKRGTNPYYALSLLTNVHSKALSTQVICISIIVDIILKNNIVY